jgi:hypothetical protein
MSTGLPALICRAGRGLSAIRSTAFFAPIRRLRRLRSRQ